MREKILGIERRHRTPEEKIDIRLEARRETALLCLAFERHLSKNTTASLNSFAKEQEIADLRDIPPGLMKRMEEVRKIYQHQDEETFLHFHLLEQELFTKSELESPKEINTPEETGKRLFEHLAKREPYGVIHFDRSEAYLVMYCTKREDYEAIRGLENPEERSGGTFFESRQISVGKLSLPIVLSVIIGNKPESEERNRIFLHERQHFINHNLLNVFSVDETHRGQKPLGKKETEEYLNLVDARQRIKDEVIAYIRDQSEGTAIAKALLGKLYAELLEDIPGEEERKNARSDVAEIGHALEEYKDLFFGSDSRALLVYHLLDVPLSQIAKMIEMIGAYYQKKGQEIQAGYSAPDFPHGVIFPKIFQADAAKANDAYFSYHQISEVVPRFDFLLEADKYTKALNRLRDKYLKARQELVVQGGLVPVCTNSEVTFPRTGEVLELNEVPEAQELCDRILQTLLQIAEEGYTEKIFRESRRYTHPIVEGRLTAAAARAHADIRLLKMTREGNTFRIEVQAMVEHGREDYEVLLIFSLSRKEG